MSKDIRDILCFVYGKQTDSMRKPIVNEAILSIKKIIEGKKKNECDNPKQDLEFDPIERCGSCFPCCYDQTIDDILELFEVGE